MERGPLRLPTASVERGLRLARALLAGPGVEVAAVVQEVGSVAGAFQRRRQQVGGWRGGLVSRRPLLQVDDRGAELRVEGPLLELGADEQATASSATAAAGAKRRVIT